MPERRLQTKESVHLLRTPFFFTRGVVTRLYVEESELIKFLLPEFYVLKPSRKSVLTNNTL